MDEYVAPVLEVPDFGSGVISSILAKGAKQIYESEAGAMGMRVA